MIWRVCIQRGFRLTNQMLSDLRAAGKYEGASRAFGLSMRRGVDLFAREVVDIRNVCALFFRRAADQRLDGVRVDVSCVFVGHGRHDPDAGHLAIKALVDGMVDAGFLSSDRRDVRWTRGLVAQSRDDLEGLPSPALAPGWRGVVVEVSEVLEAKGASHG